MDAEDAVRRRRRWARERAIAELAGSQHGVVSIGQLREAGLGEDAIRQRVGRGQLHRLHRGVYAVGHRAVSQRGTWAAAVLAGPRGTLLSHRSAAGLWGLLPEGGRTIDLTAPCHLPHRSGLRIHQCRLLPTETTERFGIPVTAVPRTLVDVAAVAPHLLAPALHEAEVQRLTGPEELWRCVKANPGRRGVARLRAAIPDEAVIIRSELERRFLALIARAGLPRPDAGVLMEIGNDLVECDCLWREQRLIVELDSRTFHDTSHSFERDRARDRALAVAGWQVVRVTWAQLRDEPDRLLSDLRQLLRPRRTQP